MEHTGTHTDPMQRQRELTELLSRAQRVYETQDEEIMSNLEYDRLYDELLRLEAQSGIVLSSSPTRRVGYSSADALAKEAHAEPMLSLDKTKSREALRDWLGDHKGLLSWKMDGLTIVLTYDGGELVKAVTRGNGRIGEVVTDNARTFKNVPLTIPFTGSLVLRGEAVISYPDFERINEELELEAAQSGKTDELRYKNPRNLCSGSVRQLNSAVTARRQVRFCAFALVEASAADRPVGFNNSREEQFRFLSRQGFDVVEYHAVTGATVMDEIARFEERIQHFELPSDGLVLLLDDIAYGESLGTTAKFPRNAMAFKWADEQKETVLREVQWSASRTGLINPVAVFDPVDLEGTTVQRASVHNVSIVRSLALGIGDHLRVYKANMIIPQIAENLTRSGSLEIPGRCPVCGAPTRIQGEASSSEDGDDAGTGTQVLICPNPDCAAKQIKSFTLFVSRDAMNIEGLSEMTLEKLIAAGLLHEYADIYHLQAHRDVIEGMDGFGRKSCDRLLEAIEGSRNTTPDRVLAAVGIPGIGISGARTLCRSFSGNLDAIRTADEATLSLVDGIGGVLAGQITAYFADPQLSARFERLLAQLDVDASVYQKSDGAASPIAGKTFVITGSVTHFANRSELKAYIERLGGKAAGSVSSKTDYLINNDAASTSSKNRKARELGVPILTEEEFLALAGQS